MHWAADPVRKTPRCDFNVNVVEEVEKTYW